MDAIIALINPFPNDVYNAFWDYINGINYSNWEHIEYHTWHQLHVYIEWPNLKRTTLTESKLKH
jgi:hypothetical protein